MFIVIPLIVLYFSFKQPARYVKEPSRKNMIWCIILGILNVIYAIQAIVAINNPETVEMGFVFELFVIALAVLYGWLAYRNYKAIRSTTLSRENVAESFSHQENRYCNKCGKELAGSSLFCDSCGAKIGGATHSPSPVVNDSSTVPGQSPVADNGPTVLTTGSITDLVPTEVKDKGLIYWITPGSALIVILITLQKWIHLKILDSYNDLYSLFTGSSKKLETKYSLFQFSNILNNINQYVSSDDVEIISIVLIAAALLVIVLQVFLIYSYVKKSNKTRKMAGFATVITCLVSILFIATIYIVNSTIAEETYGVVNTSIGPTVMPYLAILFSIIGGIGSLSIQGTTNKDVAKTVSPVLEDNNHEDNEIEHPLNK